MNKKNAKTGKPYKKGNNFRGRDGLDCPSTDKETKWGTKASNNDISWYANSPQLVKDAASISFNNPLGVGVDVENQYTEGLMSDLTDQPIPGVCSINLVPSIGYSVDGSSPINVAARNIYSFVRHANSGSRNYDSPDLMMYILAVSSAYSFYAWLCRIYGALNVYSRKNRYMPEILIESMQVDYDDIMSNINDFRMYINTCALKLSTLAVPAKMSYFKRQFWIYANIFKDSSNDKAQLYLFNPEYFYKWEGRTLNTGSALSYIPMRTFEPGVGGVRHLWTFDELRSIFNGMLSPLMVDEDIGTMSGDIQKAYGDLLHVDQIAESYVVAPVYNEEVLTQIHNSNAAGRFMANEDHAGMVVYQEPDGTIMNAISEPNRWRAHIGGSAFSRIYNSRNENPTPEEVLVGSRLMIMAAPGDTGAKDHITQTLISGCTEIVSSYDMYSNWIQANGQMRVDTFVANYIGRTRIENLNAWGVAAQFDWYPILYLVRQDEATDARKVSLLQCVSDVDNYTVITKDVLDKMNECALLSMFGVPNAAN